MIFFKLVENVRHSLISVLFQKNSFCYSHYRCIWGNWISILKIQLLIIYLRKWNEEWVINNCDVYLSTSLQIFSVRNQWCWQNFNENQFSKMSCLFLSNRGVYIVSAALREEREAKQQSSCTTFVFISIIICFVYS